MNFSIDVATVPKETSQITISLGPWEEQKGESHARAMQTVRTIRKESERVA